MWVAVYRSPRGSEGSSAMKHLVLLGLVLTVALLAVRNKIPSGIYGYDEADYMFAASMGVAANWVDVGTIPITDFVKIGLQRGSDKGQQSALSTIARDSRDPVVYRHWHGPLYYYWLAMVSSLGLNEHTTRALGMIIPAVTGVALYFGSLLILGGMEGQVAGILAAALFLWSPVTLKTSELAPHMVFQLCYVCLLLALAKVEAGGGRRYYYAAVVSTGLAFSTMEVAFVPILVVAVFGWWRRGLLASDWRMARNAAGLFLATVLVAWPSGLLKLNFLKAYFVMAYLAVFRKGAWGDVTMAQTWVDRVLITPFEWMLFAIALVLFLAGRKRERLGQATFLFFIGLMVLATIKVYAEGPRYMVPFFGAVELFTAWAIAPALVRLQKPWLVYGAVAAICGFTILNTEYKMAGFLLSEDPRPAKMLSGLRQNGLTEKTVLADKQFLPSLHYYFPRMRVVTYTEASQIPDKRKAGHVDAVLYPDYSLKLDAGEGR